MENAFASWWKVQPGPDFLECNQLLSYLGVRQSRKDVGQWHGNQRAVDRQKFPGS